jgi:sarcosine oxidase, subunit delta
MIRIPCPYCGLRNSSEFTYVGEAGARPAAAAVAIDTWRDYLYTRSNVAGWVDETWYHASGCRRFLRVRRHTVTNEISAAGPMTEPGLEGPIGEVAT